MSHKTDSTNDPSYDPHLYRTISHPTTNVETLIHLIKGSLGTGILAMPLAFYHAGLIAGVFSTVIIGAICTYCIHILVKAQYELCKRKCVPVMKYPESMKEALEQGPDCLRVFADISPAVVDIFMVTYQLGICCVYVVFVASNLKKFADFYWAEMDERLWMLIILGPLILINLIRNLKMLAPFSLFSNIITFIGLGITMYFVFRDLPPASKRNYVGEPQKFPLFVGTTLFALEAVGVIIALENNMQTPGSFGGYFGVFNIAMALVVTVYTFVGFFGYVKYGEKILGSITLNLPNDHPLAQTVNLIFSVAIFISYALQCYVPVDIILNTYIAPKIEGGSCKLLLIEFLLRIGVVLFTFILALAIPRLGLFISLFGALCLSTLGITFPAIIDICVWWPDGLGKYNYILVKDIMLIIFGSLGFLIGTATSIIEIITSF